MATLQWHKDLELDVAPMDATHREFVDLLAQVEAAADADLLPLWVQLLAHTEAHFGSEDQWMLDTGFAVGNCHATQHKVVLDIMRQAQQRGDSGDLGMLRGMLPELASWFNYHAQTMDAALAQHMQSVGYDPENGLLAVPQALPATAISGCGGACSQPEKYTPVPAPALAPAPLAAAHG